MTRKSLIVSLIALALLALAAFLIYMYLSAAKPTTPGGATSEPCLVFQDQDTEKPCYAPSIPGSTNQPGGPADTTSTGVSTSTQAIVDACSGAGSLFDRNECYVDIAATNDDQSACSLVSGSLAQASCARGVSQTAVSPATPVATPYEKYLQAVTIAAQASLNVTGPRSTTTPPYVQTNPIQTASPVTREQIMQRLTYGAALAVYAPSRYQVAPGSSFKVLGAGFTPTNNNLYIGDSYTTVSSADGATLAATAPGNEGDYEIWVTNSKGSSRVSSRPIKVSVVSNPQPLPVIESATPSPATPDGTVELHGRNFGSSVNVLTSVGNLMNVPSTGTSFRINLSSLKYMEGTKNVAVLKGRIVPILVTVQTVAGASEDIFQFGVQF